MWSYDFKSQNCDIKQNREKCIIGNALLNKLIASFTFISSLQHHTINILVCSFHSHAVSRNVEAVKEEKKPHQSFHKINYKTQVTFVHGLSKSWFIYRCSLSLLYWCQTFTTRSRNNLLRTLTITGYQSRTSILYSLFIVFTAFVVFFFFFSFYFKKCI
jgi:hypothetical protein